MAARPIELDAAGIAAWLRRHLAPAGELRLDSRAVRPGDIFVALPGTRADGRRFIDEAVQRGAKAVLLEAHGCGPQEPPVPTLAVEGLGSALGRIAAEFHGRPSERLLTIGVTGTNGKTSSSQWIAEVLSTTGRPCAVIGTLGAGFPGQPGLAPEGPVLTTPDPLALQQLARRLLDAGAQALAMEVSSIGLAQHRVEGMAFDIALFTNLTRDHLDAHGSMAAYAAAKARLFAWPGLARAVLNLDDDFGRELALGCVARGIGVIGYGLAGGAAPSGLAFELQGAVLEQDAEGQRFEIRVLRGGAVVQRLPARTALVGRFNIANLLGVLGVAMAAGMAPAQALAPLQRLAPPAGRMQRVEPAAGRGGPLALVDYAHTPDALVQALAALRPLAQARGGQLWVVVGAGGDRDAGKRPLMAAAAVQGADRVLLTSDNPRSEPPEAILDQMVAGAAAAPGLEREADRAVAIARAIAAAADADVVLIAGKGHEGYQEAGGVRLPFSDAGHAAAALAARATRGRP